MVSKKAVVILAGIAAVIVTIAACDDRQVQVQAVQPPVYAGPPAATAPVIISQPSNDGFFTGMLMGHLMSGGAGVQRNTTVINKSYTTVTRPTYAARPAPSYSRSYSSPSYSRSSSFGSFRGGRR